MVTLEKTRLTPGDPFPCGRHDVLDTQMANRKVSSGEATSMFVWYIDRDDDHVGEPLNGESLTAIDQERKERYENGSGLPKFHVAYTDGVIEGEVEIEAMDVKDAVDAAKDLIRGTPKLQGRPMDEIEIERIERIGG